MRVNALANERALYKPRFEYIPDLKATQCHSNRVLKIIQRDARHYCHQLRLHPKWSRWLAHPPVRRAGRLRWPTQATAPMALRASAGCAQMLTDVICKKGSVAGGQKAA